MGISLLEVEPDLARLLTAEQRRAAERVSLPLEGVEKGADIEALVEDSGAFAAVVLDGLIAQAVQIGEYETLWLVGPGGLVPLVGAASPMPLARSRLIAAVRTRLAMLGDPFLLAAQQWPAIVVCLHERMLEQSARLTMQNAISQLPRVEDRLLALMRLLAESWGRVTPAGIRLELSISHETLGGLVGARRSTVTLALQTLAERGSLVRQEHGWLIPGEQPTRSASGEMHTPEVVRDNQPTLQWASQSAPQRNFAPSRLRPNQLALIYARSADNQERARRVNDRAVALCAQSRLLRRRVTNRICER